MAFWQSLNLFWRPGFSLINTASILCYMMVSFRSFIVSRNTYFLNYLCQTWSHSRHLIDSSMALFPQSLTLPNVCASSLSKLVITLMRLPRLGVACYTKIAHERTQSKLNDVCHAWYEVSKCRPPDSGGLKGWLLFPSDRVIWRSIISCNT